MDNEKVMISILVAIFLVVFSPSGMRFWVPKLPKGKACFYTSLVTLSLASIYFGLIHKPNYIVTLIFLLFSWLISTVLFKKPKRIRILNEERGK
jgi:hypothetical protein